MNTNEEAGSSGDALVLLQQMRELTEKMGEKDSEELRKMKELMQMQERLLKSYPSPSKFEEPQQNRTDPKRKLSSSSPFHVSTSRSSESKKNKR